MARRFLEGKWRASGHGEEPTALAIQIVAGDLGVIRSNLRDDRMSPSFWEYPSRTVTHRSERMCHLHRKGNAAQHCQPGRKHGMEKNFVDRMLRSSLLSNDPSQQLLRAASLALFASFRHSRCYWKVRHRFVSAAGLWRF